MSLSLAGIRRRHPHASERECFLRLAAILLVQGDALDGTYLRERAERLGVSDLLVRAEERIQKR